MADFLRDQVSQGVTREQLEQGITPGFDEALGPGELPAGIVDAAIANGQVASNGYIIIENEIFADEANTGEAGVFVDNAGTIRVIGIAPGGSDRDVAAAVTDIVEATNEVNENGNPLDGGSSVSDPNDIIRAFAEFQNGQTTQLNLVEEGGLPNPADLSDEVVQVDAARVAAAVDPEGQVQLFNAAVDPRGEEARQLVDERGVLTDNGFIIVEDDSITVPGPQDSVVEGGIIISFDNKLIITGSASEAVFGRDFETLAAQDPDTFSDLEGAVVALNQFDDGDFVDVEVVG